jgi:hypothetical protein
MSRSDAMAIKAFSVCCSSAMETITMAIERGRGALLVDCMNWLERQNSQCSNTKQTKFFKQCSK